MSKKKRSDTAAFKRSAVKLSEQKDHVAKTPRELGIAAQLIYRWEKEQDQWQHNRFSSSWKSKTYRTNQSKN